MQTVSRFNFYGYRYYDPVTGRWPSRDPMGLNWESEEYNDYAYVKNSPSIQMDNLGLKIVPRGLPFQKRIINEHLEKLRKSKDPKTQEVLKCLDDSDEIHEVSLGGKSAGNSSNDEKNESNGKGTGTKTTYPATGEYGFTPDSTLRHELEHAYEKNNGTIEPKVPDPNNKGGFVRPDKDKNGIPDAEDRAVDATNKYREAEKQNKRDGYDDHNPDPGTKTNDDHSKKCKCRK
ncbi:hypothetical protein NT6N_33120 [Oceaniferula spumae]|uniref:RHS repeat-associated core domain-containing protein n=1 Tax=Oceaniferula spumae TaxID=2979115 RepID=A0AAT9FQ47_9BACT